MGMKKRKEKSEYKTAAKTEIKVENWRAKRIAELEEENRKLKEELAHYKNTDAIQNSNRKSVYTSEEQELLDLDYGTGFTAKFVRK